MSNTDNLSGKTLGTCTLERLLGQGGMGAVYLAKQTRPARNVAVKVLFPNLAPNSEVYQEFLVRFRREADIVARLEHVNIMPIYEYGEESGLAYLVMPYLSGGSLRDVLARRGALPLSEVIKYTEQAASALDYAHRQGVVHRDLKPANFLLHADGRLVLADFGIARIMEGNAASGATLTSTGTILGTPEYMAPEMAQGETIDFRADIYELGIVIFQLLSGHVPFAGNTPYAVAIQHIQEPLPSLRRMNPAIPAAVDAVLQKATSKHREERYTTVSEMAEALRRAQFASSPATARQSSNQEDQFPTVAASPPPPPSGSGRKNIQTPPPPPSSQTGYHGQQGQHGYTNPTQGSYTPPNFGSYQPSFNTPIPASPQRRPWWILIGILFALVLIIGGVIIGIQLSQRGNTPTPSPTVTATQGSGTATSPTPNTGATVTSTPGQNATATPTAYTTPTAPTATTGPNQGPTPAITAGPLLYAASSPGPNCDHGNGKWAAFRGPGITCQNTQTTITSTATSPILEGMFLTGLPNQDTPSNYVIQAQLNAAPQSNGDFGIYFRNQPGSNQQGVYAFLIHADGTWSTNVYDNATGAGKEIAKGAFGDVHTPTTVDIAVNGQQFSFYANGRALSSITDSTYTSGTVGIAVGQNASIVASNFALYQVA